jgi:hypothetical protein
MATMEDDEVELMTRRYREAASARDFVREAAARSELGPFLEAGAIPCDAFFACAEAARAEGVLPELREDRAAALAWYAAAARILRAAPGRSGDYTAAATAAGNVEAPGREAVGAFLLAGSRPPAFHGAPHQVLFLRALGDAAQAGAPLDEAAARLAADPRWLADYVTRSSLARIMGPRLVELLILAASRADERGRASLLESLEALTGLPAGSDGARYLAEVERFYAQHRSELVVSPDGLYPAPGRRPAFVVAPPAGP